MVATYAQKQAVKRYTDKLKAKGFNHHTVFCTDNQWKIFLPLMKYIKGIKIENLQSVELDDENGVITFIPKEGAKINRTDIESEKDDTTHQTEQETSTRA